MKRRSELYTWISMKGEGGESFSRYKTPWCVIKLLYRHGEWVVDVWSNDIDFQTELSGDIGLEDAKDLAIAAVEKHLDALKAQLRGSDDQAPLPLYKYGEDGGLLVRDGSVYLPAKRVRIVDSKSGGVAARIMSATLKNGDILLCSSRIIDGKNVVDRFLVPMFVFAKALGLSDNMVSTATVRSKVVFDSEARRK